MVEQSKARYDIKLDYHKDNIPKLIKQWRERRCEITIEARYTFGHEELLGFTGKNGLQLYQGKPFTGVIIRYGIKKGPEFTREIDRQIESHIDEALREEKEKTGGFSPDFVQDLIYRGWWRSALMSKKHYVDGLLHGMAVDYAGEEDEQVFSERMYHRGEVIWVSYYHDNGQLDHHKNCKSGERAEGYVRYYHYNGEFFKEEYYVDGRKEGRVSSYWTSGQLVNDVEYKADKKHGLERRYSKETGLLIEENFYEEGELIESKKYDQD